MTLASSPPASAGASALLTAPIMPLLLRFALPNMVALLASAMASISETRYVGQMGTAALAGLALVFPMVMLQMMMSAGAMGGGVSSAVSRALGAGRPERANALAVHALWIAVIAGALYMALLLGLGRPLYALLGGRGDALEQAVAYGKVAFLGAIFMWVVNTLSSVIRGAGHMAVPSAALLVISVAQALMGGALGLGWGPLPALGMPGVAAGQVIAYGFGALYLYAYLRSGRCGIRLHLRGTPLQRELFADILKVGMVALASPVQTVLTVLILTRLVAQFGTEALAGYGIGSRLEFLLVPIVFAIGVASVPLVGMAIGAGQIQRARRVAWLAAGLSAGLLGLIGAALAVWPDLWTTLFTQDAAILASAARYFQWAGPAYAFYGFGLCLYFSSLGAGKILGPVLAGTLRLLVIALGGAALAASAAPAWSIFALVGTGMVVFGLTTAGLVHRTAWGVKA